MLRMCSTYGGELVKGFGVEGCLRQQAQILYCIRHVGACETSHAALHRFFSFHSTLTPPSTSNTGFNLVAPVSPTNYHFHFCVIDRRCPQRVQRMLNLMSAIANDSQSHPSTLLPRVFDTVSPRFLPFVANRRFSSTRFSRALSAGEKKNKG